MDQIRVKPKRELTFKQRRFVKELVGNANGNLTEAASRAYNSKTRQSAMTTGSRLLRNVNVKSEIEASLRRAGLDTNSISQELKKMATAEVAKVTDQGKLRALELALKLYGAFPATKSIQAKFTYEHKYQEMKLPEIVKELEATRISTEQVLSDLKG